MNLSDAIDTYRKYNDPTYGSFAYPLTTVALAISAWEEILDVLVTPIIPASATKTAALAAFTGAASGMNVSGAVFIAAINAFKDSLGSGMVGYSHIKSDFIITDLGDPSLLSPSVTHTTAATTVMTKIHSRLTQNQAQLIALPNTISNWS